MAQTYTADVPDGTTNILQDNINGRNNENTLKSNFSGTAFPDTPVAGQHCYRTDTGIEYIYDGTAWVEVAAANTLGRDVAAAKGALNKLSSRLNVSINPDGTLKDPTTANVDEFKVSNVTPTFVDATMFSVPDDLTGIFTEGRILKITDGAEVKYLSVVSSAFDTVTNVVIDGTITASITAVDFSLVQYGLPLASETVKGVVELATVAETTAGTVADKVITPSALNASPAMRISDCVYNGEDLTVKFASEIAGFDNVWAWIKSRITAGSYDGIHIADYIPFTITGGEQFQAQVAGIDTYLNCGDEGYEQDRHIDFISRDCKSGTEQWNTTNNNNGNATNAAPWMVSNIRTKLNALVSSLPAGLQSVVVTKIDLLETRYTSGSTLTSSTSWEWNDMGKLWLPSEYEVNGSLIWSGTRAVGLGTQYPIFANSRRFAIKGAGHNGNRATWLLSTVYDGNSTSVCLVYYGGSPVSSTASTSYRVPLCFRIS